MRVNGVLAVVEDGLLVVEDGLLVVEVEQTYGNCPQFFQYEWHDAEGQWWRSYGNELWEFAENGLMSREASINDHQINETERRIFGPRPVPEHGLDFPIW